MYINHVAAEECRETDGFCPACNDFHPHIKASMEREEERRAANIKAGVKGTEDREEGILDLR
jgi:hypothetical protein